MNDILEQLFTEYTKDPAGSVTSVVGTIELVKPMVYAVLMSLFDSYKDLTNNKEYFQVIAQFNRNMFDALLDVGFNEEQALALMLKEDKDMEKRIANSSNYINKK